MQEHDNILDMDSKTRLSADITYLMLKGAGYAAIFVLALWFIIAVIAGIGRALPEQAAYWLTKVPEYGGKFSFGFEFGQQPPVDGDLAAGQRPGVGHRVVQDNKFVRQVDAALRGDLGTHVAHVGAQLRIDIIFAALGLLHRQVILPAHFDFLRRAHEDEFAFARDRVD